MIDLNPSLYERNVCTWPCKCSGLASFSDTLCLPPKRLLVVWWGPYHGGDGVEWMSNPAIWMGNEVLGYNETSETSQAGGF